jgi:hypothetical protein
MRKSQLCLHDGHSTSASRPTRVSKARDQSNTRAHILQPLPLVHQPVPDQLDLRLVRDRLQVWMEDGFFLIGWLGGPVAVRGSRWVEGLSEGGG